MSNSWIDNQVILREPYCYYFQIRELIRELCEMHERFSHFWLNDAPETPINLKRKEIRHICEVYNQDSTFMLHNNFYTLFNDYLSRLEDLIIETDLDFDYSEYDLRMRVKQNESIVNKIRYYRIGKEGNGKYAIKKCLNDLFGIRIHVPGFQHSDSDFNEMCVELKKEYSIKFRDSSKQDYKATHVYFEGNKNKFFPWELQIWNPNDVEANIQSHEMHKQEYVSWAKVYKESSERGNI